MSFILQQIFVQLALMLQSLCHVSFTLLLLLTLHSFGSYWPFAPSLLSSSSSLISLFFSSPSPVQSPTSSWILLWVSCSWLIIPHGNIFSVDVRDHMLLLMKATTNIPMLKQRENQNRDKGNLCFLIKLLLIINYEGLINLSMVYFSVLIASSMHHVRKLCPLCDITPNVSEDCPLLVHLLSYDLDPIRGITSPPDLDTARTALSPEYRRAFPERKIQICIIHQLWQYYGYAIFIRCECVTKTSWAWFNKHQICSALQNKLEMLKDTSAGDYLEDRGFHAGRDSSGRRTEVFWKQHGSFKVWLLIWLLVNMVRAAALAPWANKGPSLP